MGGVELVRIHCATEVVRVDEVECEFKTKDPCPLAARTAFADVLIIIPTEGGTDLVQRTRSAPQQQYACADESGSAVKKIELLRDS